MFNVGDATITRIEETYLPTYPVKQVFPAITDAQLSEATCRGWRRITTIRRAAASCSACTRGC